MPKASSNAQNISPRSSSSRSMVHRLRSSVEAARRSNTHARPTSSGVSPSGSNHATSIDEEPLIVTPASDLPSRVSDGEMASSSSPKITLVRKLARPQFQIIDPEKIAAVDENLVEVPLDVLRMGLDLISPEFIRSFATASVVRNFGNKLPKDANVLVNRLTAIFPSHVLFVTGQMQPSATPLRAQVYPVHSLVLATQCPNMPAFPPSPTISVDQEQDTQEITLPIQAISVPHQPSFTALLRYLYYKDPTILFKDLMPLPLPETLLQNPSQATHYASKLAASLTEVDLLRSGALVNGLWRNVCAFSIDDETLWYTIDLMWEVFVSALTTRQQRT